MESNRKLWLESHALVSTRRCNLLWACPPALGMRCRGRNISYSLI